MDDYGSPRLLDLGVGTYVFVRTHRQRLKEPFVAFVVLGLLFGILFSFIMPPFFALDESVHFNHAYQVSGGHLLPQKLSYRYYGGYVTEHVDDTVLQSLTHRSDQPGFRTGYRDNFNDYAKLRTRKKVWSIFNSTAVYPPVPYVPQATGIFAGRVLHLPTVWLMYLGRLTNLVVWVVLVALAVRLLPFGKWALVVVALLPTSVVQASSLSADALTTALAFLAAAYVLRLACRPARIDRRQFMLVGLLMLLLSLTKQTYACFVLLIFALPVARFRTSKTYWTRTLALVLVCLVPAAVWTLAVRHIDIMLPVLPNHPPIDMVAQLKGILLQPYYFGYAVWSTYLTGRADITASTFIGQFGRIYDLHLPLLVVAAAYGLLATVFLADERVPAVRDRRRLRTVFAAVLVLSVIVLTTILYLTYTTLKGHFVDGLQARYFLPLMVLLIPLAKLRRHKVLHIQTYPTLYLAGSSALLILSTGMMIHRFYTGF